MEDLSLAWILIIMGGLLLFLIGSGMYIGLVMGLVGIFMMKFMVGSASNLGMLGIVQYNVVADNFALVALPLFIFMGYLVLHIGLAERIYDGSINVVGFIPGGLLHANIFSSSIFAAMCGSSLATAASLGSIAIPLEVEQHKYPPRSVMGSLAAGGTLGILIPPSITFIAYGVFVGESIGQLFAAGIIPGVILAFIFMLYIFLAAIFMPSTAGPRIKFTASAALMGLRKMWSAILLIGMILVTIYFGIATPTEAAGVGCLIAMAIGLGYRRINSKVLKDASTSALYTTCFLILLMVTAQIVSLALSMLEVPQRLTAAIVEANIGIGSLFAMVVLMYLLLGCFLEPGSMLFLTLPIVHPLMTSLGFSPVWLGVIMVVLVELGNITPPVGFNLFVIHGVADGRPMIDIIIGVIPFWFCLLAMIAILYFFPELALWLPSQMFAPR
jgi:tripartite ATP-independent transporter DctM subunit